MSDLSVAAVRGNDVRMEFRIHRGTAEDWAAYRKIRLRMLADSPDAYGSSYAFEARFPEEALARAVEQPAVVPGLRARRSARRYGHRPARGGPDGRHRGDVRRPRVPRSGLRRAAARRRAAGARDRGARRLVLHVTDGNEAANRCYTRYGFCPTGRRWPMPRNPELVEVELAFELTPGADG